MNKDKFLNDIVFGWIKNDLEHMRKDIYPSKYAQGCIHFPLALCTLAYMEFLGGFLHDGELEFLQSVKAYVTNCSPNPNEYDVNVLYKLVRNNLAHNYFPYGSVTRNDYDRLFYKGPRYNVNLDAEFLVKDFINSLETFKEKLVEEKYYKRMEAYSRKRNKFESDNKEFIDSLELYPNDSELAGLSFAAPPDGDSGAYGYNTNTSGSSRPNINIR